MLPHDARRNEVPATFYFEREAAQTDRSPAGDETASGGTAAADRQKRGRDNLGAHGWGSADRECRTPTPHLLPWRATSVLPRFCRSRAGSAPGRCCHPVPDGRACRGRARRASLTAVLSTGPETRECGGSDPDGRRHLANKARRSPRFECRKDRTQQPPIPTVRGLFVALAAWGSSRVGLPQPRT